MRGRRTLYLPVPETDASAEAMQDLAMRSFREGCRLGRLRLDGPEPPHASPCADTAFVAAQPR